MSSLSNWLGPHNETVAGGSPSLPRQMATRLNTNTMSELTRGSFHLDAELARSSGGVVYRARVRSTGQTVVLKQRLRPELGAQRNMLNEVELLQRLHHPHVIRCLGHFWDSASLYMVLEHADRGDLYAWLQRRKDTRAPPLEERTVWHLFYQISQGLQHIHSKGIVHRDIKSLNIFLCSAERGRRGRRGDGGNGSGGNGSDADNDADADADAEVSLMVLKLGDLGVSRSVGPNTEMLKSFYGTPLYASPELMDNKPYNDRSDIWSLGVVLYELATYEPPFMAPSLVALARCISKGHYAPLPNSRSPHLQGAVAAMLQVRRGKRRTGELLWEGGEEKNRKGRTHPV